MRILVEPNAHHHLNMGDVAMLQMAVSRLREHFPNAHIEVITDDAERLERHCPGVSPVPAAGRRLWFENPYFGARLHRFLPGALAGRLRRAEERLRHRRPAAARSVVATKHRLKRSPTEDLDRFLDAMHECHLLVVAGAGAITDPFAPLALTILELCGTVADRGAPTAMMGQGLGPIEDARLLAQARSVLPGLGLLGLREGRAGVPLATSLDVPVDRIVVTGDDAVELAYENRADASGDALGLSLRVARYSELDPELVETVARVAIDAAERRGVGIRSIPISAVANEADAEVLRRIAGDDDEPAVETPADAIRRAGRCRVVVTGSYHAAVFALAQGIPAIGLARSPYYVDKFLGLAELFGAGCSTVALDGAESAGLLRAAIDDAWAAAEELRGPLIDAAAAQRDAGRAAYARLAALVDEHAP
jgi:polysaccharide pyruvyl transferase WcaK-like protein